MERELCSITRCAPVCARLQQRERLIFMIMNICQFHLFSCISCRISICVKKARSVLWVCFSSVSTEFDCINCCMSELSVTVSYEIHFSCLLPEAALTTCPDLWIHFKRDNGRRICWSHFKLVNFSSPVPGPAFGSSERASIHRHAALGASAATALSSYGCTVLLLGTAVVQEVQLLHFYVLHLWCDKIFIDLTLCWKISILLPVKQMLVKGLISLEKLVSCNKNILIGSSTQSTKLADRWMNNNPPSPPQAYTHT